ncbi:hypothetical protein ACTWQB_03505 [Piscibacillus sp. B03]|uniref:hypothetical protein n=1 Tax=Piscibacillus sp. B03 TaxID=3457430 RepID=UPI003FCE9EFC
MSVVVFSSVIIIINLLTILIFIHPSGKQMESMITTMVLTSSTGLSIGFLAWVWFGGQPIVATLLAIGLSALVGMLIGMKFGVKCQVEGFFSGLMASMMGIMLIMMFDKQDGLFLLMTGLAFLVGITVFSIAKQHELKYSLLSVLCISITLVFFLFPKEVINQPYQHEHHSQIILTLLT